MNLYNYDEKTLERLENLPQGFYINYDSEKEIVLSLKGTAGLVTSIIKGCPINLYLNKKDSLVTLYIIDNKINPQYFVGNNFSKLDNEFKNFESVVIELIKSIKFRLIILNDANYQIVNTLIEKENYLDHFKNWINNNNEEFEINLSNKDFSNEEKITYLDLIKNDTWDNNLINDKPYYNFNEYIENGSHGYNQEFSIRTFLSNFFEPNIELFPSLFKKNGEELTDFLITYKKAVVVIESKYTISPKQTKFNSAISKAINQLQLVKNLIYENPNCINNELVVKELLDFQVILNICVFYDNGRNLTKSFQNFRENYDINILPIFISVIILNQIMSYIKINDNENFKYYIINNFLRIKKEYMEKNEIIIIKGFDLNTGKIEFVF
ncbi:hypothetical protein [Wenyingzhuangia sp. IMCC45467]